MGKAYIITTTTTTAIMLPKRTLPVVCGWLALVLIIFLKYFGFYNYEKHEVFDKNPITLTE